MSHIAALLITAEDLFFWVPGTTYHSTIVFQDEELQVFEIPEGQRGPLFADGRFALVDRKGIIRYMLWEVPISEFPGSIFLVYSISVSLVLHTATRTEMTKISACLVENHVHMFVV